MKEISEDGVLEVAQNITRSEILVELYSQINECGEETAKQVYWERLRANFEQLVVDAQTQGILSSELANSYIRNLDDKRKNWINGV